MEIIKSLMRGVKKVPKFPDRQSKSFQNKILKHLKIHANLIPLNLENEIS